MKIKESDGTIIDIFVIYWLKERTLFLGMPRNYGGLIAYDATEVEVVDSTLQGTFEYFSNGRMNSVCHWALIKKSLLDDLIERDETAYNRFIEIIKSEGLVDADFY